MKDVTQYIQQSIIRDMSEGVMIIGLNGSILHLNPAAEDILGKKREQWEGQKKLMLFLDDERNDQFSEAIIDAIENQSHAHYKLVNYYTDDNVKTIYMMTSFLHEDNERLAMIVILNDMTNLSAMRKRYTDQLLELLDSLVLALSVSIDERSHYNANHTRNMVMMAEKFLTWLDETEHPFRFDKTKKHAFLMSVWLHDVGKLSVPLKIMDKATRLDSHIERIDNRFDRIHLLDRLAFSEGRISGQEFECREKNRAEWLEFIKRLNNSGFLSAEDEEKINRLASLRYEEEDRTEAPYLTEDEIKCLHIKKGTLTDEERAVMQSHVVVTKKILDNVSFPDDYSMVPEWASSHHELLNGKGYPNRRQGDEIPPEVRLLTILDIFEALTAKDRPYKKPIPLDRAWSILHSMADEGSIDKDILELFKKSGAWHTVAG